MKSNQIISLSVIALLGLAPFAQAGKIGSTLYPDPGLVDQVDPGKSSGFGGWNFTNVDVNITDLDYNPIAKTFNTTDGSYTPMVVGDSFQSGIDDGTAILVNLHGKDWPVGEPAGIKVIEEGPNYDSVLSHSKPANCIMTTSFLEGAYLDAATPSETLCSSPFQSHKRFKLNMLPTMVEVGDINATTRYGQGVDLSFNVRDTPGETWRYMVLQKINNYTGKRLDGFKVEIGFIVGAEGNFTKASDTAAAGELMLSIGTGEDVSKTPAVDIWDADELATFSHGLFGPQTFEEPVPHFATDGFFDNQSAGYTVALTTGDTIAATGTLGSNYTALPVTGGAVTSQFGNWLPSIWAPTGIFWDDDNDPTTDAQLVAFWGDTGLAAPGTDFAWMKGDRDGFAVATAADLAAWASSPVHAKGEIEDVLNLGLNYIVQIGDTTTFPTTFVPNTITVRITPRVAADQTPPTYDGSVIPPLSNYLDSAGTVEISPTPYFDIGSDLTLVVADLDLIGTGTLTDVNVTTSLGEYEMISLTEIDSRGVFTAVLPTESNATAGADSDGSINVTEGTVVTVNYADADNGTGAAVVSATSTAGSAPTTTSSSSSSGSSFAVNDKVSLLFTIFGFLVIGGLIARRKLA